MIYKISHIAEIVGAKSAQKIDAEVEILLTDSRSLTFAEQTLFFALKTSNNDGHRYIPELYSQGVRNFVVEYIPIEACDYADANFLEVGNTKDALQSLATYHRSRFAIPVVAITGSRGKTIVKEWLYELLRDDYNIVRSPRSYNSQIGVPLSLWEIDENTTLALIEAGVSRSGEMAKLKRMIAPTMGVFTTLTDEHGDGFASRQDKYREKMSLFNDCDVVISDEQSLLHIENVSAISSGIKIEYSYNKNKQEGITIPMSCEQYLDSVYRCLEVMLRLGYDSDVINARMKRLTPTGTRLNVIEGVNNCMLIKDAYTADFHSLIPALDFMLRRLTAQRTATVILSDVTHESMDALTLYRSIARLLQRKGINRVIGIGEEIKAHGGEFGGNAKFYALIEEFLSSVTTSDFDSELILLKGTADARFEKISDMLESRLHETVLEVNLDAMLHNYNMFRSMVKPETGIVCMVKASGYGAGSYELAKTLQSQGAAYLAVAAVDEGVDLRRAGITMPIMVLNPRMVNYKTLFSYHLEPEIYSFEVLDEIISEAQKCGITDYPVHIKLDTGMHRLGFREEDMARLVEVIASQSAIKPRSVFSHLATADCPDMDEYTLRQFDYFDRCCDKLQQGFDSHIMRHILNSTGIIRFPEHQHDMVRLGICLYGVPTLDDEVQRHLKQISALYSTIISIKEWDESEAVGYSRRGVLYRHSRIATVPIGYADGIDRHLGNGRAEFVVNGKRCPTVGNICMDICMIDVTDVDCHVGDQVEIFGPNIPVTEVAERLDTIPYEILTSVSMRVKRIYYRE